MRCWPCPECGLCTLHLHDIAAARKCLDAVAARENEIGERACGGAVVAALDRAGR